MNKLGLRVIKDIQRLFPRFLSFSILAGIFSGVAPFVSIYASQQILNQLASGLNLNSLIKSIIFLLLMVFVYQMLGGLFSFIHSIEYKNAYRRLELERNLKMTTMEFQYAEDPAIKDLRRQITIIGYGGSQTFESILYNLKDFVFGSVSLVISVVLILPVFLTKTNSHLDSPLYFLAFIFLLAFFSAISIKYGQKQNVKITEVFNKINYSNSLFNYLVIPLFQTEKGQELRLYKQEKWMMNIFRTFNEKGGNNYKLIKNITNIFGKIELVAIMFNTVLILILYIFVGLKAINGSMLIGNVVASVSALSMLITILPDFLSKILQLTLETEGLSLHYQYMDLPNQTRIGSIPIEKRLDNDYQLSIRNLHFTYPKADKEVLQDINLDLEIGKSYAIVGENGSGKTTFIKLLTRIYDSTQGEVLLNGIPVNKYDTEQYYDLFNVVFQDFDLFSFKLGETIATKSQYNQDKVLDAFEKVGFMPRYQQLPKGLETSLNKEFDKEGINLSGGEKQKLAIARALYKDGPIYILDEPTAALDPISEFEIYQQFHSMTKGKTTLIISHRLSSCRFCDEILVFDQGRIIQQGSHAELVNVKGKYRDLWNAQAQYYRNEKINLEKIGVEAI